MTLQLHSQAKTSESESFLPEKSSVVEMAFPASTISVLLAAATLFSVAAISDAKLTQGLHLDKYSEEQVKGCYTHNQTLGVCFDVRKGFMKMTKSTGEEIVLYVELGPDVIFYQVLDQAFVGG